MIKLRCDLIEFQKFKEICKTLVQFLKIVKILEFGKTRKTDKIRF